MNKKGDKRVMDREEENAIRRRPQPVELTRECEVRQEGNQSREDALIERRG